MGTYSGKIDIICYERFGVNIGSSNSVTVLFIVRKQAMKNFSSLFFCAVLLLADTSFSQNTWLRTDKKEFDKILSEFGEKPDSARKSGCYPSLDKMELQQLSTGAWRGYIMATDHYESSFNLYITQTTPIIEGTFEIFFKSSHEVDTIHGVLKGLNISSNVILVLKYDGIKSCYDYLEGKAYLVKRQYENEYVFAGIGEQDDQLNTHKELFVLFKKE